MYNSHNIADNIKSVAKKRGITVKKMLEDIGLGFNTMANMKTSMPKADNLAKIADYLGCSVDYLLGRTDCPELITMDKLQGPSVIRMPSGEKVYKIKVAARDGGGIIETTITDSDLEKINALRDVDDL